MEVVTKEFTTCKGTFLFPRLNSPEIPPFEGYDGPPIFSVTLRVKDAEAQPMVNFLNQLYDEQLLIARKERGKRVAAAEKSWEPEVDNETDEETGYTLFRCKLDSMATRKRDGKTFNFSPDLFDSKGNPTDVEIGGGTVGRLRLEARGWVFGAGAKSKSGVKLTIRAAKITELHQYGGRDAETYGFVAEDGFEDKSGGDDEGIEPVDSFGDESGDVIDGIEPVDGYEEPEEPDEEPDEELEEPAPKKAKRKPAAKKAAPAPKATKRKPTGGNF